MIIIFIENYSEEITWVLGKYLYLNVNGNIAFESEEF